MILYEMLIAIGIAVVLVVAAIGGLAARVMMGPEEMALLRAARAAAAQRHPHSRHRSQRVSLRSSLNSKPGRERINVDRGSSYARVRAQ